MLACGDRLAPTQPEADTVKHIEFPFQLTTLLNCQDKKAQLVLRCPQMFPSVVETSESHPDMTQTL